MEILVIKKITSSLWSILEYGWSPLLTFLSTPYFLHSLGADAFGYWMLLITTVGFGSILNAGNATAIIKIVSSLNNSREKENIGDVVSSSLTMALIGGGVLAGITVALFGFAGEVLFAKMGNSQLLFTTGVFAAFLAWIEQVDVVFSSTLKGTEQFKKAAIVEVISKTMQIFGTILAVYLWKTVTALYVAILIVALIRLSLKFSLVITSLSIALIRPSFIKTQDIFAYAKWGWLQGVGGLLFGVSDRMLVGSILGAASLSHYSMATQLASQIHALSAAGLSIIFPKVSRELKENHEFSLLRITKISMIGNLLATSLMATGLLIFGKKILILWVGLESANATYEVFWYLIIAYWLMAINVVPYYILLALGKIRFVALSNFFAGIVTLIGMYVLIDYYGLRGVGMGQIVYGTVTLVNFISLYRYFKSGN